MLTDGHSHVKDVRVLDVLRACNVWTLACGMDPAECGQLREWAKACDRLIPTYGIHPWNAEKVAMSEMTDYLHECCVIGEIGMDSVWCKVPLEAQERAFVAQLDVAQQRNVPVVLHTKGQELEIAKILKRYSIPALVHWYSCDKHLERYLDMGCYFTIGPDIDTDPTVQEVAKKAPLDRILVETDGVEGIAWAKKTKVEPEDIPQALMDITKSVAKLRNIDPATLTRHINTNFARFCGRQIK